MMVRTPPAIDGCKRQNERLQAARHAVPASPTAAGPAAFTLLELLIASALTATLLVLVWSLFGVYTKLNEKGSQQATEMQLVRALIRQFRSDLRHMIPEPQHRAIVNPVAAPSLSVISRLVQENAAPPLPDGPAFLGTSTSLEFFIRSTREPAPVAAEALRDGEPPRVPNVFDHVSYRWHGRDPRVVTALPAMALDAPKPTIGDSLEDAEQDEGLVRRVVPWHQPDEDETTNGSIETIVERDSLLADVEDTALLDDSAVPPPDRVPEVVRLRFRYFDGRSWRSSWNSRLQKGLPAAIEVAFELEDPELQRLKEEEELLSGPLENDRTALSEFDDDAIVPEPSEPMGLGAGNPYEEPFAEYRFVIAVTSGRPSATPSSSSSSSSSASPLPTPAGGLPQ